MTDAERLEKRLSEVTTLAGGLVHEIRNPLSTANLNLQLLQEDWQDPQSQKEQRALKKIQTVRREVQRLDRILEDFLGFVKAGKPERKRININTVLAEVVEFVESDAERKGIQVRTFYDRALPDSLLDDGLLKQAFLNILVNAQQAMPEGGDLMIRTSEADGLIEIDITDTGTGIADEALRRIFEVYYSTKTGGTGLGLPTTRRIIEGHDGEITIQSEEGKGTNVRVALPIVQNEPEPSE